MKDNLCGKNVGISYIIASGIFSKYFALVSCVTFMYTTVYYTHIFVV